MKHFKLTSTTKVNACGITLYQLELIIDCKWGNKGAKGGWVEKTENCPINNEDDGFILGGEIWGDAVIWGGEIRGGVISGGVIRGGEIRGGVIRGGVISGGVIRGDAVIWGGEISGGVISGGVIRGGVIKGDEWLKSPLQIQGSAHFVCESRIGYLQIGCIENKTEVWIDKFKEIGKEQNYTPEQIEEYGLYIELAAKIQKINLGKTKSKKI